MDAQASRQDTFALSYSSGLPRGKACITCRIRKVRCDGIRPVCGTCRATNRSGECEYSDGSTPSSTYALEARASELRARIRDLQHPRVLSSRLSSNSPLAQGDIHSEGTSSPIESLSQQPSQSNAATHDTRPIEIPAELVERLSDAFFSHRQPLWFLHTERFRTTAAEHPDQNFAAIINTICMVATAHEPKLSAYEDVFRTHAYSELGSALAFGQIMHVLQAHTLLSAYAFTRGDFLAARTHICSASSLARRSSLDLVRSTPLTQAAFSDTFDLISLQMLPEPRDHIDEEERANAFWTIFSMEVSLGVALDGMACAQVANGGKIRPPWPLDMEQYKRARAEAVFWGEDPLYQYLLQTAAPVWVADGKPLIATSKAAALLERSVMLASSNENLDDTAVAELDSLCDVLATEFGPTALADSCTHAAHLLLRGATFMMHYRDVPSERTVHAARALASASQSLHPTVSEELLGFLELAVGMVIPAGCRVLMSARVLGTDVMLSTDADSALDDLVTLLEAWSQRSVFVGIQLERIVQERAAL